MTVQTFKHWRCEIDDNKIFWVIIDRADKSVNTMSREVMSEFNGVIDLIEEQKDIIGVAIKNGKKTGFIAGADISEFTGLKDSKEALSLMKVSQDVLLRLEKLKLPTIALIDGFALGGGYEIALACTYRVALDSPKVRIGLPETLLGIHPGWAGSVRLPKLIGAIPALKLIIMGKTLNVYKAKKAGLIDDIARNHHMLEQAALYYLTKKPKPHTPGLMGTLSNMKPFRTLIAKKARADAMKKINPEFYPAPFAVIDNWEKFGVNLIPAQEGEAQSLSRIFLHPTAKELVRVFFLQDKMKALAKGGDIHFAHVHVIGAGVMGGDIAAFCALHGMRVTLQDREEKFIAPAIKRAHALFKMRCTHKREVVAAMDRLIPDVNGFGIAKADLIIEAIFENLDAKQKLYKALEPKMKENALLATNTSSIPLEDLATALKKPDRLVGIHFFNPVAKMKLVEVVRGQNSSDDSVKKALAFVGKLGKLPLPVASSPGFLINRILMPYMIEAYMLMDEGVPPAAIDKAAVDFGMPMGPLELGDIVGLDVGLSVGKMLKKYYGGEIPKTFEDLVERGHLGKKTGSGVYTYHEGKPVKVALYQQGEVPNDLTDRLMFRMLNEAVACLDENVIDDPDLLDAGMIFGTGFAPFRGGPIRYINTVGADVSLQRLERLHKKHGERFTPSKGWIKLISHETKKGTVNARL